MVSAQTTTGPVRSVMNRMSFVCCATNQSQGSANGPHSFCSFTRANMAEEELAALLALTTKAACVKQVFLVTMHLALCLQMPGLMVGMDQKDVKNLALHILQRTQGCA